ncbi:hypothetical protein PHYPSEUDO_000317 [Phytophthora pseudosyringae]|uniref:Uncharacterized protein n=1 Tax=Phytophthora pseudosyringae TaxID=221518 RepID=A0A8T1W1H9_9STRA|nr:hypothetical protein PHYPSEUDO_000317 [Phytophthora pseudosyringae]
MDLEKRIDARDSEPCIRRLADLSTVYPRSMRFTWDLYGIQRPCSTTAPFNQVGAGFNNPLDTRAEPNETARTVRAVAVLRRLDRSSLSQAADGQLQRHQKRTLLIAGGVVGAESDLHPESGFQMPLRQRIYIKMQATSLTALWGPERSLRQ